MFLLLNRATYTHPEVAHVGFYEEELIKLGIKYTTFQLSMDSIDRAILESEDQGFAKVHVKEGTDKIIGATIVSRNAGDLISQITTMMQVGIGLQTISTVIFPYPTQAEVIRKLGDAYNKTKLTPTAKLALETLLAFRKTVF
jgi:pyruvate/2-oxoglutarate dehydrogenase complex dihydrolipoamide dehydrogenase (E3) component